MLEAVIPELGPVAYDCADVLSKSVVPFEGIPAIPVKANNVRTSVKIDFMRS